MLVGLNFQDNHFYGPRHDKLMQKSENMQRSKRSRCLQQTHTHEWKYNSPFKTKHFLIGPASPKTSSTSARVASTGRLPTYSVDDFIWGGMTILGPLLLHIHWRSVAENLRDRKLNSETHYDTLIRSLYKKPEGGRRLKHEQQQFWYWKKQYLMTQD